MDITISKYKTQLIHHPLNLATCFIRNRKERSQYLFAFSDTPAQYPYSLTQGVQNNCRHNERPSLNLVRFYAILEVMAQLYEIASLGSIHIEPQCGVNICLGCGNICKIAFLCMNGIKSLT
jgi:hypothetical protein